MQYRSVAAVPPAYYAQLAAERGQLLAQGKSLLGEQEGEPAAAADGDAGEGAGNAAAAAAETAAAGEEPAAAAAAGVGSQYDVRVNVRLGGSMYYV